LRLKLIVDIKNVLWDNFGRKIPSCLKVFQWYNVEKGLAGL
jgi:hypothetical protein